MLPALSSIASWECAGLVAHAALEWRAALELASSDAALRLSPSALYGISCLFIVVWSMSRPCSSFGTPSEASSCTRVGGRWGAESGGGSCGAGASCLGQVVTETSPRAAVRPPRRGFRYLMP
jgi:hypothetical protein